MMVSADWLSDLAQQYPDRMAVIDATSGRRHTFGGFDNRANQIAHFCESWVGLLPGDCIGLLSTTSDDVLQIAVAAGKLGLMTLFLDPTVSSDALIEAIGQHTPRTVFYGLAQGDLVQEIWFEVDSVEHFIPLRGAVDTANFEDIVAHYPTTPPLVQREEGAPWVCFAAEEVAWLADEVLTSEERSDDLLGTVALPLYRPGGFSAAVKGLGSGCCLVVETDSIGVIESPIGIRPTQDEGSGVQRNVPEGRSWLPHEFL
jgi:acyl-CoA synthetase (AMP-forming)/AMP-acid ligase II